MEFEQKEFGKGQKMNHKDQSVLYTGHRSWKAKIQSWENSLAKELAVTGHKLLQGLQSSGQLVLAGKSSSPEEAAWLCAYRQFVLGESMQCLVTSVNLSIFCL